VLCDFLLQPQRTPRTQSFKVVIPSGAACGEVEESRVCSRLKSLTAKDAEDARRRLAEVTGLSFFFVNIGNGCFCSGGRSPLGL
jgi:hypothetical protein